MLDINKRLEHDEKICQKIIQVLKEKGYLGGKFIIKTEFVNKNQYRIRLFTETDIFLMHLSSGGFSKQITTSSCLYILFCFIFRLGPGYRDYDHGF